MKDLRNRDVTSFLPPLVRELAEQLPSELYPLFSEFDEPIESLSDSQLLETIEEPSSVSEEMGGVILTNKSQSISLSFDWSSLEEQPFSRISSGFEDAILFKNPDVLAAWTRFWKAAAEALSIEYFYVVHDIDLYKKRRLPRRVQRKIDKGEAPLPTNLAYKPAYAIPFVPWLLILGPRYVEYFTLERLESIDAWKSGELSNGGFWLQTAESPLEVGKKEVLQREQRILDTLGRAAFFDPSNPWRMAEGPDYPRVYKEWIKGPPGGTWDVYVDEKGEILKVDVTEDFKA